MTMKLRTWKYYIEQGFKGIAKNGLMSFASALVVSACAFIVILSLCIAANINNMLDHVESRVGVVLYMGEKPSDRQIEELQKMIEKMDGVNEVKFTTAEDALKSFSKQSQQDFTSFIDDNPLPRSLEVSFDNIDGQNKFLADIEKLRDDFEDAISGNYVSDDESEKEDKENNSKIHTRAEAKIESATRAIDLAPAESATKEEAISPKEDEQKIGDEDYKYEGIENIQHAQELTDVLLTINAVFRAVSVSLIAILSVISIGIIMNTIKLNVFIRRNEIGIMKYVGATDWFIRWPFIIEGIVIGIIGSIIPIVICWLGYLKVYNLFNHTNLINALGSLKAGNDLFMMIAPFTILVGILLGVVGSVSSIRKHLKV